jgi:hypothetical protein
MRSINARGEHDDTDVISLSGDVLRHRPRSGGREGALSHFWQTRPMTRQFSRQSCQ